MGQLVIIGAFVAFLIRSSQKSAMKLQVTHSIYLRIFVNYLSVMMIISDYELNWPTYVHDFLAIQA
jgi:hypothetical protein